MPPPETYKSEIGRPETYKSEIGSQPTMCQVHTGAYVSLLAPGKTDYTACHPRKTTTYILHVYIARSTYHYAYARQTQVLSSGKVHAFFLLRFPRSTFREIALTTAAVLTISRPALQQAIGLISTKPVSTVLLVPSTCRVCYVHMF